MMLIGLMIKFKSVSIFLGPFLFTILFSIPLVGLGTLPDVSYFSIRSSLLCEIDDYLELFIILLLPISLVISSVYDLSVLIFYFKELISLGMIGVFIECKMSS